MERCIIWKDVLYTCEVSDALMNTGASSKIGVQPRIMLSDVTKHSYIQSDNHELWYNNSDKFINIKPCQVQLNDLFKNDPLISNCHISKCGNKRCKTCSILGTNSNFTSSLTNKSYCTRAFDDINCKTCNVVYGITCSHCGLIYVGETKGQLNKRISSHRFQILNNGGQLLYQHFNLPDHYILSMGVIVIEKIYHHTNSPSLSTPYRREREEYWIKELGTASPYGCNDNVSSIGNLTSPSCSNVNVMHLFPSFNRKKRSHGTRHYTPPRNNQVLFNDLLDWIFRPLGIHHIRTKLFSIPLPSLNKLYKECLQSSFLDPLSREYKLNCIILDIGNCRLFKPVNSSLSNDTPDRFSHLKFANKGIDAINIYNILHNKHVRKTIPPYFKYQANPKISYTYSRSIASKLFNYKQCLQDWRFTNHEYDSPPCSCSSSQFLYQPAGHIVTGDLNIVDNTCLRDLISKGPKYREPQKFSWKYNFKLIMDSIEEYARSWAKQEDVELDTLSEWVKSVKHLLKRRIYMVSRSVNTKPDSIFDDEIVSRQLADLHDRFVIVPADKASNNVVFICKTYYYSCLQKELIDNNDVDSSTYQRTDFTKEEILVNHRSVLTSFGVNTQDENVDLPSLYWIPKLHKDPYKQRFIAGSAKCSTKPLSILLTSILTTVKDGLKKYCDVIYSRSGINQMWILKNSKELLENLNSNTLASVHSIKTYDFSTLYTTIPHSKLKSRLTELIRNAFRFKNGKKRYEYIVVGYKSTYFVKDHSEAKNKYTEDDIVRMLEFLIDNIFVECGGVIFQQVIGIPMGTNCAPLLADLFLYSYEAEFIQTLIKSGKRHLAKSFHFTYRYIDDVLSINNPKFGDYIDYIYPVELEIKDTTDADHQASYLDLDLSYNRDKRLLVKLYDKRDDFNFNIVNFPFLSSNIPQSPAYGVYVSQLIRYARASSAYSDFLVRSRLLTSKLLGQGYNRFKLITTFKKFYGRHSDLIGKFQLSVTHMVTDLFLETLFLR